MIKSNKKDLNDIKEEFEKLRTQLLNNQANSFESKAANCGIKVEDPNSQTSSCRSRSNSKSQSSEEKFTDELSGASLGNSFASTSERSKTPEEEYGICTSRLVKILAQTQYFSRSISESSASSFPEEELEQSEFVEKPTLDDLVSQMVTRALEEAISELVTENKSSESEKGKKEKQLTTLQKIAEKISTLNPSSPEFKPNTEKSKATQKPHLNSSLNPSSPEFMPIRQSLPEQKNGHDWVYGESLLTNNVQPFEPSIHVKPVRKKVHVSRNMGSQTPVHEMKEMGSNTRRVKLINQGVETKSCDNRDVCVNTMESYEIEGSDRVIDVIKTRDQSVMTVKKKTRSQGVMTMENTNNSANEETEIPLRDMLLKTQVCL